MKKKIMLMLLALLIMFSFVSCDDTKVPNPLIGSYFWNSAEGYPKAAISFAPNNRFVYFEVLTGEAGSDPIYVVEGTYELLLGHYDFLTANGKIIFKYRTRDEWPDNFLLGKGGRTNLWFSWKCDKDSGPYSLNLVLDENNDLMQQEFRIYRSDWKDVKAQVDMILGSKTPEGGDTPETKPEEGGGVPEEGGTTPEEAAK